MCIRDRDEGDNYGYEQGRFSTIRMEWDDSRGVLSVGQREGSFPSMEESRKFRVVLGGSADEVFREEMCIRDRTFSSSLLFWGLISFFTSLYALT